MTSSAEQMRAYKGPAFFSFGFRPFFLGGAITAAIAPLVTVAALSGVLAFNPPNGLIAWHAHEMVYGYLAAVIAGFILTAVPNWTGRLPINGLRLAGLAGLWLAGRAAILSADFIGAPLAMAVDCAFLIVLDLLLWREVITGKNWRNVPICILIGLLGLGNILWHMQLARGGTGTFGVHWGLGVVAVLLALIGGRVTPSFTRNWLAKTGAAPFAAPFAAIDKVAIAALVAGVLGWLFAPGAPVSGAILMAAGALHYIRLMRWRGWRTIAEPLVVILHFGYFWLATALVLLGLSLLAPSLIAQSAALHALTAGAAGVMTLAVMTRATRGHAGHALEADRATIAIYILVNIGAGLRVAAPLLPVSYNIAMGFAALVWSSAFAVFALVYGRYLVQPRRQ
ncbi:MAG: NnrS family protein [Alphaproteobacteria bacterium]|nr:NnrS family protein [Alphaproteobacteria bacterium]